MSDAASEPATCDPPAGGELRYRSKGQLAMIAAMNLSEADRLSGVDAGISRAASAAGVSRQRIHCALLIRKHARHLVQDVIDGRVSIDHAYALVQEKRRRDREAFGAVDRSGPCDRSGPSDPPEPTVAPQSPLVLRTKRNSGRTGPKRLTPAEVAQRDKHAAADHRRRYGQPLPANEAPMPPAPPYFTKERRAIWEQTLSAAPPGLLQAGDADNLVVLCSAVDLHRRLMRQLAESTAVPGPALIQQLRQVGAEVGRASKVLGLTPPERVRIGIPTRPEQAPADEWAAFPTVVAGGKAV